MNLIPVIHDAITNVVRPKAPNELFSGQAHRAAIAVDWRLFRLGEADTTQVVAGTKYIITRQFDPQQAPPMPLTDIGEVTPGLPFVATATAISTMGTNQDSIFQVTREVTNTIYGALTSAVEVSACSGRGEPHFRVTYPSATTRLTVQSYPTSQNNLMNYGWVVTNIYPDTYAISVGQNYDPITGELYFAATLFLDEYA